MTRFTLISFLLMCVFLSHAQPKMRYSIDDKKAIGYFEEAVGYYRLHLVMEAEQLLSKAIERTPEFCEAYLLRAELVLSAGRTSDAMADLQRVTEINPRGFNEAFFYLGDLKMRQEAYSEAMQLFEQFRASGSTNEHLKKRNELMLRSAAFAQEAKRAPVDFKPINLGPSINTPSAEYFPCITADDNTLVFTRLVRDSRVGSGEQEDFYFSQKREGNWIEATPMRGINTVVNEGAPTLSVDGQLLFFTACEALDGWGPYEGFSSCDIFVSRKTGETWSKAENLKAVNSFGWDSQPSFSADGKTLFFIRGKTGADGIQEQDIYYSEIQLDGSWSKPSKIKGKVNTEFEEESVMIHPDGETLYFSSNGHAGFGGLDIFMSKLQSDGTWGEPKNLGYPINTGSDENSLLVSAGGVVAYFASDREGGYGNLDLYQFELPESARPEAVSYMKGTVYDEVSFKKLEARFELIDLSTGELVVESYSDASTGEFLVCLPPERDYALNVSRQGYLFYSDHFSFEAGTSSSPFMKDVPMRKLRPGSKVVLNNVFFATDSYSLEEASLLELNKLVMMLRGNPELRIEISGHTDDVGSSESNQALSERRAQAVVDYLISSGIESVRLRAAGYGESRPVGDNGSEEGRALNRRTELEVL